MKTIKRFFVGLAIASMGLVSSSCGITDIVEGILESGILENIIGGFIGNGGTQTTYSGTYSLQMMQWNSKLNKGEGGWELVGEETTYDNTRCVLTVKNNLADIVLPGGVEVGDGKGKLSQEINLGSLVLDTEKGSISVADDGLTGDGSLTVNGKAWSLANAYVEMNYSENSISTKDPISLYFGEDCNLVVNVTFKGTAVAE